MRSCVFKAVFAAFCVSAIAFGCSSEDTQSGSGSFTTGASGATTGGGGDATSAAATGATTGAATSGASTGTGSTVIPPHCGKSCATVADCCPEGQAGCPGAFPMNHACEANVCIPPHCETDEDCSFGGAQTGFTCHPFAGLGVCIRECTTNEDCTAIPNATCSGDADDGAFHCSLPKTACVEDTDCLGNGVCMADGSCQCTKDEDCTASTVDVCVK